MLYQKLLPGADSYFVNLSRGSAFEEHCHPEIELSYCFKGSYTIIIAQEEYLLKEGDLAIVNPMVSHEFKQFSSTDSQRLTIEIAPSFLEELFSLFVSMNCGNSVFPLGREGQPPIYGELSALLNETVLLMQSTEPFSQLSIKGNVYKISAILLKLSAESASPEIPKNSLADIKKIGIAVNMIYNFYNRDISLDEVSTLCGYSKSNFCKVFKMVTGETFHSLLNRHRIDIACMRLKESDSSVEEIALSVGFPDSKSFSRTFKKITGTTALAYRKK